MDHKRRTVRHVYEEINKILFTYWDPIGMNDVLPKDEYEAYVGAVYGASANGTSEEGLVRLLTSLENEMIGLRAPWGRKVEAARRLRNLNIMVKPNRGGSSDAEPER